ncbi:hypothetical protein C8J57DRAFT_1466419 [Mycena rebaudengoi]|nr:hypothetical protein C8J57DRAFT_1466419 [Mycena rebaudengoi]
MKDARWHILLAYVHVASVFCAHVSVWHIPVCRLMHVPYDLWRVPPPARTSTSRASPTSTSAARSPSFTSIMSGTSTSAARYRSPTRHAPQNAQTRHGAGCMPPTRPPAHMDDVASMADTAERPPGCFLLPKTQQSARRPDKACAATPSAQRDADATARGTHAAHTIASLRFTNSRHALSRLAANPVLPLKLRATVSAFLRCTVSSASTYRLRIQLAAPALATTVWQYDVSGPLISDVITLQKHR